MPLSEDTIGDSLSVCCKNALPHCNKKQWFMENGNVWFFDIGTA